MKIGHQEMKLVIYKFLFILLAITATVYSQNNNWQDTTGGTVSLRIVGNKYPLPVMQMGYTISKGFHDTITVAASRVDTASRKLALDHSTNKLTSIFPHHWQITSSTCDDTLLFSTDPTFPANNTWYIYPLSGWVSAKYETSAVFNFYIKTFGMGQSNIDFKVDGD